MFGKVRNINENSITLENITHEVHSELMGCHVVFDEAERKIVGEITKLTSEEAEILLVGEIQGNRFSPGALRKPTSVPRIITKGELELVIGAQVDSKNTLLLGGSNVYKDFRISVNVNDIFANHFAIIGNSGSGKSCGVTRMLQNLFLKADKPVNSHFVLFDAYGEYKNAFSFMNESGLGFKRINTEKDTPDSSVLRIPLNFLDVDDLAILLSVNDADQIPVLEKALKLTYIFTSKDEKVIEYKNDIIAKCLLDILTSGKSAPQMRDQIVAVLSHYNTKDVNLESTIEWPGYNRTLAQCLIVDDQGKMNAMSLVIKFLNEFVKVSLDDIVMGKREVYTLDDLYYALEFALISEGTLNSGSSYDRNNILKARLQAIINGRYKQIFEFGRYITKEEYITKYFFMNDKGKVQLVDVDLSYLDDRFAKVVTKLLSKLFFNYTSSLTPRGTYPINIILEEAHRYVQSDTDIDIIGYNIFDRITKEGRKYGTFLTFITQRPSELSPTALSQCSNFVVFRIFHPKDFEIVRAMSTNITMETLNVLKTLNSGTALGFGTAFKIPVIVNFDLADPMPESSSLRLNQIWY